KWSSKFFLWYSLKIRKLEHTLYLIIQQLILTDNSTINLKYFKYSYDNEIFTVYVEFYVENDNVQMKVV
ncbi:hypothetical protein ACWXWL_23915, partial [Pantoea ananatis]